MGNSSYSWFTMNRYMDGGWFWGRYSVNPYNKCSFGCTYCFLKQKVYQERRKEKMAQSAFEKEEKLLSLRQELASLPREVIVLSGYQKEEEKEFLLPPLLKLFTELSFPVVIIVKSPLIVRDIELLRELQKKSWVAVVMSVASFQSEGYLDLFEPNTPSIEERFQAMRELSKAGLFVGTALMPIAPKVNDSDENLEKVVKKTKEHGGKFVLAGGLVLSEDQKPSFYSLLKRIDPQLVNYYEKLYGKNFSPEDTSWAKIGNKVKTFCLKEGLYYRMPRYVDKEDPFYKDKKENEKKFLDLYEMELSGADDYFLSLKREELQRLEEGYLKNIDKNSLDR